MRSYKTAENPVVGGVYWMSVRLGHKPLMALVQANSFITTQDSGRLAEVFLVGSDYTLITVPPDELMVAE